MKKVLILIALVGSFFTSVHAVGLDTLKVSLPSLHWALQLNLPGYEQQSMDMNTRLEGRYISAVNDSLNIYISISMEENVKNMHNAVEMRDTSWTQFKHLFWERKAILLDSARYESGNCAFTDFYLASINDMPVKQRNIIIYILSNNICITIQLLKSNYSDADLDNFNKVLGSIKIIAPYSHVSIEHFIDGSVYFTNGNYLLAAKTLQKSLDLNKTDRALTKEQSYWLMANLGLAYGLSGQIGKAVTVLNQGIQTDRYFPMFYYNLACIYAQTNDLTETIYYLYQAAQYKKNMPPNEEVPNPGKDELFRRYWKDDKFREAVRNM